MTRGKGIFFKTELSEKGRQSCSTLPHKAWEKLLSDLKKERQKVKRVDGACPKLAKASISSTEQPSLLSACSKDAQRRLKRQVI